MCTHLTPSQWALLAEHGEAPDHAAERAAALAAARRGLVSFGGPCRRTLLIIARHGAGLTRGDISTGGMSSLGTPRNDIEAARWGGWMRALRGAGIPLAGGPRGGLSSRTSRAHGLAVARRWGFAPGRLLRQARRVRALAWCYTHPRRVALPSLADAVAHCSTRRIGGLSRAARALAASAIRRSYGEILPGSLRRPWEVLAWTAGTTTADLAPLLRREWLRRAATADTPLASLLASLPPVVTLDGVDTLALPAPAVTRHGVTAQPCLMARGRGAADAHLVTTAGGRSYHAAWPLDGPAAIRQAVTAWRRQARASVEALGLSAPRLALLLATRTPLVWRANSAAAGNCAAGTAAWAAQRGWAEREFVPLPWIVATGDARALRAAAVALREGAA